MGSIGSKTKLLRSAIKIYDEVGTPNVYPTKSLNHLLIMI